MTKLKGPDGLGFYYGTLAGDRIDIRHEDPLAPNAEHLCWHIYINGDHVGAAPSKEEAEREALEWLGYPAHSESHG